MIKAPSIKALWILHCAPVFTARLISTHLFYAFFYSLDFYASFIGYVHTYPAGRFRLLVIRPNPRRFISMIEHVARKLDNS